MSAGLYRAYAPLFHEVTGDPDSRRRLLRIGAMLSGASALVFWLANHVMHSPDLGKWFCCLAVLGWVAILCGGFVNSAVRQNQPANASLVPQLRRRLSTCCVALFAASSLLMATVAYLFFGHFGYALAGAGLLVPYLLLMQRALWIGALPVLPWWLEALLPAAWFDGFAAALPAWGEPALATLGIAADILLLLLALRLALPRGGDRHIAWARRRAMWQVAGPQGVALRERERGWTGNVGYARVLRRDSRPTASPGRQMMHALGAGVQEGACVWSVLGLSLIAVAALLPDLGHFQARWPGASVAMFNVSILMAVQSYASALLGAVDARAGEVGLYRLTPAAPHTRDFNRVFATTVLMRFARVWLVSLAGLTAVTCAANANLSPGAFPLALASLTLPLACLLPRNPARLRARPADGPTQVMTVMMLVGFSVFFQVTGAQYPDFPWLLPAGVIAAGSLLTLWRQWQTPRS